MQTENTLKTLNYKRILYVTDLSESGRHAFPHAASFAKNFNADLTVYHVVDNQNLENLLGYASESLWQELKNQTLDEARETLISRKRDNVEIRNNIQQFCDDSLSSASSQPAFAYEVKVDMGDALEKILAEAHSGIYDMLVISKHGYRLSVKDAVIGDTARRVIRRCKIPVLIVPLPEKRRIHTDSI